MTRLRKATTSASARWPTAKTSTPSPGPIPTLSDLLNTAARTIAAHGGEHFIAPNLGFALFERAWSLRGFEQFFMDIALDPGFAADLLDRITEIQLVLIRRFIDLGVDGGYFGDDYGAQKGLLFAPRTWRQLIKPRLARLFAPFREAGLPILMHSDGQIQQILPDLVEIGLTALNPVQPEVLDHIWLRENFGGKLAFYGGISTQTVLPHGTPDEVRAAVAACVRDLAPDGTGLLLAPSHRMMTDIPLANVAAMVEAFRQPRDLSANNRVQGQGFHVVNVILAGLTSGSRVVMSGLRSLDARRNPPLTLRNDPSNTPR